MKDFFLSHSSEDKEFIVRPVYNCLLANGKSAWFDEAELTIGDSLISSIQNALVRSKFLVVFLSKKFVNKGWPIEELNSILNIQISTKKKRVLPIVVDLSHEELSKIMPFLSEKIYIKWNNDAESVAKQLINIIDKEEKNRSINFNKNVEEYLSIYKNNLINEINNNLVLELYDKPQYEDICITPFVYSIDKITNKKTIIEIGKLLEFKRSIIIGEPGSGKTTALRKLALDLLHQEKLTIIPIYISLASFSTEHNKNDLKSFADYVKYEVYLFGIPDISFLFNSSYEHLFLLDGWDEVADDHYRDLIKHYLTNPKINFIITSRPEAQRTLPFAEKFEMHPLSKKRIKEFIKLRISNVNELFNWIIDDERLLQLAMNPLNLSIITIVYMETGTVEGLNKAKLYERAFEAIIRQYNREHTFDGYLKDNKNQILNIDEYLKLLAYDALTDGEGRFFSIQQINKVALKVWNYIPENLHKIVSGKLGIIRDRRSGRMEFFHLWYQEFLVAKYILDTNKNIVNLLNNAKLASSLPYVIGLISNPKNSYDILINVKIIDVFNFCRAVYEGDFDEKQLDKLIIKVIRFGENHIPKIPVRIELSKALSQINKKGIPSFVNILKNKNFNDYIRRSALEALALLTDKDYFSKILLELLEDTSVSVLWHVLEHVGRLKVNNAYNKLRVLAKHKDPIVAGDATWALNQILNRVDFTLSNNLIDQLINCLSSDDIHLQGHALRTLGRLKISKAIPKLKEYFKNIDAGYRWIVPEAICLINSKEGIGILNDALEDSDLKVVASTLKCIIDYKIYDIPNEVIKKIQKYFNNTVWISFLDEQLGLLARNAYEKIIEKKQNFNLANIFIARHCKTSWNKEKRLQGTKDLPLSKEGREEAISNLTFISKLDIKRVITSNSLRALETAKIYANYLKVPLHIHPGLRELDHGYWEGKKIDQLVNDKSSLFHQWLNNPESIEIPGSVESASTAQQRILEAVKSIAVRYNGENVLIITHKHIKALLFCSLKSKDLKNFKYEIDDSTLPMKIDSKLLRDRLANI